MLDKSDTRLILGIDPGIAETGWAVVKASPGEARVVESSSLKTYPYDLLVVRIDGIVSSMKEVLDYFKPNEVAMESLVLLPRRGTVGSYELTGALRMSFWREGHHIHDYAPSRVKKVTSGHGNADKEMMAFAVSCVLEFASNSPHRIDAAAVAYTHMMQMRKANDAN